jgi:hypothetical protein
MEQIPEICLAAVQNSANGWVLKYVNDVELKEKIR